MTDPRLAADAAASPAPLSRRSLFRVTGAGVLLGSAGAMTLPALAADQVPAQRGAQPTPPMLDLDVIQGNSLVAFGTTHQHLLFVRLPDAGRARAWLAAVKPLLASCQDVMDQRTRRRVAGGARDVVPRGPWSALALSATGMRALGVPASEVGLFPEAFQEGMRARAALLGDVGPHDPADWVDPFAVGELHAVVIAAADGDRAVTTLVDRHRALMAAHGVELVGVEAGRARPDAPHDEHFGFRDGISQPGVRGLTAQTDPVGNPNQGVRGQDLVWPGEFVLGHPTQVPRPSPEGDINPEPGPLSSTGPAWATDGSFVVFRRLRQDVAGFRAMIRAAAAEAGMAEDVLAAKLVGRWPSGASVLSGSDADRTDPSLTDPTVLDPDRINDFEFGEDLDGARMPRCAHIRKTYPRDEELPTGGEAATQTHRMLRRGITYGPSFDDSAPETDRGLLFVAYQSSIARQFEFVQRRWINDPDIPAAGDGGDPLIATGASPPLCRVPTADGEAMVQLATVVTTTGGEYFFQPSLPALTALAAPRTAVRQRGTQTSTRAADGAGGRDGRGNGRR